MHKVRKLLFGTGKHISQRIMFWNMCSSIAYSVQSFILLLVVTRVGGLYQAGIFSIIYTVTQTLASLGSYSMRSFQVSDTLEKYSFIDYFSSRVFTCCLMVLAVMICGIYKEMPIEQLVIMLLFALYRGVDGIEDVFHAAVQKAGRLDVASIAMAFRIVIATMIFGIVFVMTKSLFWASFAFFAIAVLIFVFFNQMLFKEYFKMSINISFVNIKRLLWECFPVFLGAILYNYLNNAPKYAIDRNLSMEAQTIFNIVFMPILVINVLSSFIFKPLISNMGEIWNRNEISKFSHMIVKQCLLVGGITIVGLVVAYWIGCPILSVIFGVELLPYRNLLCMLLCFGGLTAFNSFFNIVLTVMRKQVYIIIAYISAFLINIWLVDRIVIEKGLIGAGIIYGIVMGTVFVILIAAIVVQLIRSHYRRKETTCDN